jgi:uncharacterized SAM-binding protein YcdF (DUF218 family)
VARKIDGAGGEAGVGVASESSAVRGRPGWWRRSSRRLVKGLLVLAVLGLLLAALYRPLLVGFAQWLRVDDPAPSDAIVLLLGGSPHRPQKAAELYCRGIAPVIVFCHEPVDPVIPVDRSGLTRDYLVRQGIPADAVRVLPGEVGSTYMEARQVVDQHPARRIILVTTSFHTRRARWVFRRVLRGRGVDIRVAAATDPAFNEHNWYLTEDGLIHYGSETIKTIYYWIKY